MKFTQFLILNKNLFEHYQFVSGRIFWTDAVVKFPNDQYMYEYAYKKTSEWIEQVAPFMVIPNLTNKTSMLSVVKKMCPWLEENTIGRYLVSMGYHTKGILSVHFEKEKDAVLFKLSL